jgi:hypothetical protein
MRRRLANRRTNRGSSDPPGWAHLLLRKSIGRLSPPIGRRPFCGLHRRQIRLASPWRPRPAANGVSHVSSGWVCWVCSVITAAISGGSGARQNGRHWASPLGRRVSSCTRHSRTPVNCMLLHDGTKPPPPLQPGNSCLASECVAVQFWTSPNRLGTCYHQPMHATLPQPDSPSARRPTPSSSLLKRWWCCLEGAADVNGQVHRTVSRRPRRRFHGLRVIKKPRGMYVGSSLGAAVCPPPRQRRLDLQPARSGPRAELSSQCLAPIHDAAGGECGWFERSCSQQPSATACWLTGSGATGPSRPLSLAPCALLSTPEGPYLSGEARAFATNSMLAPVRILRSLRGKRDRPPAKQGRWCGEDGSDSSPPVGDHKLPFRRRPVLSRERDGLRQRRRPIRAPGGPPLLLGRAMRGHCKVEGYFEVSGVDETKTTQTAAEAADRHRHTHTLPSHHVSASRGRHWR